MLPISLTAITSQFHSNQSLKRTTARLLHLTLVVDLALVEESVLSQLLTRLVPYVDIDRRQQKDFVSDSLNTSPTAKDQSRGKVDNALCVVIVEVSKVHYDWNTVAVLLADSARIVVGPGVDCFDAGEVNCA